MAGLVQFNQNVRRVILALALPGILLITGPGLSQIRLEQIDPGVLIKPQQVLSESADIISLQQVDPSLRKVQPKKVATATSVKKRTDLVAIAQPRRMPFVLKGVNMVFADNPARAAFPVVSKKIQLN